MTWNVEYTDEFEQWWNVLNGDQQVSIHVAVILLEEKGPFLMYPYSSGISGSQYSHMRELRVQHQGEPYRVLYAFDPRRSAILLIGGNKAGHDRWYEEFIPLADQIYAHHLSELEDEGLI